MKQINFKTLHVARNVKRVEDRGILLKTLIFTVTAVMLGQLCACSESQKTIVKTDDMESVARLKIYNMGMTPDSLRSAEDLLFKQRCEALLYEGCTIRDGKFELINNADFKKFELPDIYYNILKKDMDDINAGIYTMYTKEQREMTFESFLQNQKEYLERTKVRYLR